MGSEQTNGRHSAGELLEALHPLMRRLDAQRTISAGKVGILRHLADRERATATELAAAVQVSPQAISLAAGELDALGLVRRIPDTEDRRRSWIILTDAGRQKVADESSADLEWLHRTIEERLAPHEQRRLQEAIPLLRKLGSEGGDA